MFGFTDFMHFAEPRSTSEAIYLCILKNPTTLPTLSRYFSLPLDAEDFVGLQVFVIDCLLAGGQEQRTLLQLSEYYFGALSSKCRCKFAYMASSVSLTLMEEDIIAQFGPFTHNPEKEE